MKKALFFISKHLLTAVFAVVLIVAFLSPFFVDSDHMDENRRMAEFPSKIDIDFPKIFESYYMDNFPNRKKLIRRYSKTRFKKFGINNYLVFGDNDWLFYNSKVREPTDTIGDYLGTNKLTQKLLESNVDHLVKEIGHMQGLGAEVYVMIVPNKATVYSEIMPDDYKGRQAEESKAEQIMKALKERGVKVVESKDAIVKAKEKGNTYYRTDTHWNNWGAYASYKELEKALIKNKVKGVRPINVVKMEKVEKSCGDLQKYLFLSDSCKDENWEITYDRPMNAECKNTGRGKLPLDSEEVTCFANVKDGKKLVVVRDSFADAMMPMLSTQFGKSVYLWRGHAENKYIRDRIIEEKPDIIVLEYLERFVGHIANNIFESERGRGIEPPS